MGGDAERRPAGLAQLGILCAGCLSMLGCDSLFYYPNRQSYGSPREYGLTHESVNFSSADGTRLHGWFLHAKARPLGTVLHLHGNAGNITGHFHHVAWLPAAGWNVLTFDYRGYGQSHGRVSRAGTIADAHAALDYLLTRQDLDCEHIVAFGQSLGGAIGIVVTAERKEIRGLAVDGAFDSYQGVAKWHVRRNPLLFCFGWWIPRLLMTQGYDPIEYVSRITPRPLFIMHGTKDSVVDPRMARRLYESAAEPKDLWLIDGADHYGAIQDRADEACPRLLAFFNRCIGRE